METAVRLQLQIAPETLLQEKCMYIERYLGSESDGAPHHRWTMQVALALEAQRRCVEVPAWMCLASRTSPSSPN